MYIVHTDGQLYGLTLPNAKFYLRWSILTSHSMIKAVDKIDHLIE